MKATTVAVIIGVIAVIVLFIPDRLRGWLEAAYTVEGSEEFRIA